MHQAVATDRLLPSGNSLSPPAIAASHTAGKAIAEQGVGCADPGRGTTPRASAKSGVDLKAVADMRRQLGRLLTVPPELARLTGPARAIIGEMSGSDAMQNGKRFRLGKILARGQDAVQEGHYLVWCRSIGLQPRTAQNYTCLWRTFGSRYAAFCALKTTTIYRLARSPSEIVEAALEAAKGGPLTAEAAFALLAKRGGSPAGRPISQQSETGGRDHQDAGRTRPRRADRTPAQNQSDRRPQTLQF